MLLSSNSNHPILSDDRIVSAMLRDALAEARKRARKGKRSKQDRSKFYRYQSDPAAFGREVLGDNFTDDVIAVMNSVYTNPVTVAQSANATGKSLPADAPVLTPAGYRSIGDLSVGDMVIGRNGRPTRVTGVYPQGQQPTYMLLFSDGAWVECSEDHLWQIEHYDGSDQVLTTAEIIAQIDQRLHIPICDPVEFPAKTLPMTPHALGIWFASHSTYTFPPEALLASIDQRRDILAGILDAYGAFDDEGNCVYTEPNPLKQGQVRTLVNSLGGIAFATHNNAVKFHQIEGAPASLVIRVPFCPFTAPLKIAAWRPQPIVRIIESAIYLGDKDSVCIRVEAEDRLFLTQDCIVTHNTHSAARIAVWFYKCFPGAQVYTTAAPPEDNLRRLLWGEISNVVSRHPSLFTDDRRSLMHLERSPVEFLTGVTIPLNTQPNEREARFSGKHAPYLLFIVDEGDAVPSEIYRAIEGCMSGGFARMLIMLNPRQKTGPVWQMTRDRRANVLQLSAINHPNVITGKELMPGAVNRETTVRRIQEMSRPLSPNEQPDSQCFQVPAFMVGYTATGKDGRPYPPIEAGWRKVTENSLWYMTFGEYPPQGDNQLIADDWIDAAVSRWHAYVARFGEVPPVNVQAVIGLDVADFGVDSNVLTPRWGGFVGRCYTWGGVDLGVTADRTVDILATMPPARNALGEMVAISRICVDANGLGAGAPPLINRRLRHKVRVIGVRVTEKADEKAKQGLEELGEFVSLRDQLWWAVREWLRTDKGAMLPPDDELRDELLAPTYGRDRKGNIHVMSKDDMKAQLRRSPDKAESLMLTFVSSNRRFKLDFL
jgi:hypothetical protein